MSLLSKLREYSKFLQSMLEEFDEDEERGIIDTFPERFRDKLDLSLDFVINDIIYKDEINLKLLIELLYFLDIEKINYILSYRYL